MKYTVYTDGACKGNPGPGGWGFLVLDENQNIIHEGSGPSDFVTTNNRMEMKAVIEGLKHFEDRPDSEIEVKSDSAYVVNCFNQKWMDGWIAKGWKTSSKKPVVNKDLWIEMRALINQHKCAFTHVKGHSDDDFNNRVDELATNQAKIAVEGING